MASLTRLTLLFATATLAVADFSAGWNGKARTPPLGWRSWNAYGNAISQPIIVEAMLALVSENRTILGKPRQSLCKAAGYCSVGVDEGWEACGVGVNGTQHDAQGRPTVNQTRFPSLKQLVDTGHQLGLEVGWYQNGCKCAEKQDLPLNYAGDVESLHAFGFDGVKMGKPHQTGSVQCDRTNHVLKPHTKKLIVCGTTADDCGMQKNMSRYAELMLASGKNYSIENHKKPEAKECGPMGGMTGAGSSACPSLDWCPFNWFRASHE